MERYTHPRGAARAAPQNPSWSKLPETEGGHDTDALPSNARNIIHTPILHVNVVLQLDLHIPNFEALNLNTSAFFVRLEMSTRTQSFTHLRTCTKDFFKSSFLHTIFYEHFNARPHQVRLDRTHELVWQETCCSRFLSIFLLFSLRCCHCITRWVPHFRSAALIA